MRAHRSPDSPIRWPADLRFADPQPRRLTDSQTRRPADPRSADPLIRDRSAIYNIGVVAPAVSELLQRGGEGVVVAFGYGDFGRLGRVELGHYRPLAVLAQHLHAAWIDIERTMTAQ